MLTLVPDDYCPEVFRGMVKRGRGGRQRPYGAWPQNHPAHTSRLVSSRQVSLLLSINHRSTSFHLPVYRVTILSCAPTAT